LKKGKIIGLITEGLEFDTPNGILTWINNLVNSLPQFNFVIINLTNSGRRKNVPNKMPHNVLDLIDIPIWSEYEEVPLNNSELQEVNLAKTERNKEISRILVSKTKYNKKFFANTIQKLAEQIYPRADIYHAANAGLAGVLGVMLKEATKAKLVVSEHGSYYKEWILRLYDKFFPSEIKFPKELSEVKKEIFPTLTTVRNISSFTFNQTDFILPVTKAHVPIERKLGAPPGKIRIIYNGFYAPERNYLPEEHIFENDAVRIGTLGRINPIKGIDMLIKVAHKLVEKSNRYEFHVYGPIDDYDYYMNCKTAVENLNIEDKIIFHKFSWDPYKAFEQMDIFTLFSHSEGLPFALIESSSFGLPIVASEVGGVREVLDGFGITIRKFKDVKYWTKKIEKIAENKNKFISHIKRQRKYVEERFSITSFQKQMESIYLTLFS